MLHTKPSWTLVTVLLLAFCALFVPHLMRTIQYDEAATTFRYTRSPITALLYYDAPNNHLLNSFLMWISTALMGDVLLALRWPAFAAGLLSIAALYRISHHIAGRAIGILAGALLIPIPLFAEYVTNGRGYTLSILLTLLLVDRVLFRPKTLSRRRQRVILGLTVLLVITLPTMLILIAALLIWSLITPSITQKQAFIQSYWLPMINGSAFGTLFYTYGFSTGGLRNYSSRFGIRTPDAFLSRLAHGFFGGRLGLLLAAGFLLGLWICWQRYRTFSEFTLTLGGVTVALALLQYAIIGKFLYPRNYSFLLPFIALVSAVGWHTVISHMTSLTRLDSRYLAPVLAGCMLIVGGYSLRAQNDPTQVDELDRAIRQHIQPNQLLIIACCFDYPIYYLQADAPHFDVTPGKDQIVIIPTDVWDLNFMLLGYDLPLDLPCTPRAWNTFEVFICPRPENWSRTSTGP